MSTGLAHWGGGGGADELPAMVLRLESLVAALAHLGIDAADGIVGNHELPAVGARVRGEDVLHKVTFQTETFQADGRGFEAREVGP